MRLSTLFGLSIFLACVSSDDITSTPKADAGVEAGADAGPGPELYVSTDGKDTNAGTRAAPLRTIAGALSVVVTQGRVGTEIRVCKGTYPEASLDVRVPVKLHGGYNCSDWTRAPGFPNPLMPDPNDTRIENGAVERNPATLTLVGPGAVEVEGFTIVAGAGPNTTVALALVESAVARVSKNVIIGGSSMTTSADAPGTLVVAVNSSKIDLDSNVISGGTATASKSTAAQLVALFQAGGSRVVGNTMFSGRGTGASGVEFMIVNSDRDEPETLIQKNVMEADTVRITTANLAVRFVLAVGKAQLQIAENAMGIRNITCEDSCLVQGTTEAGSGSSKVYGNFLDLRGITWPGGKALTSRGVEVAGGGLSLEAENNVILQAEATGTQALDAIALSAFSCVEATCDIDPMQRAIFRHNTAHVPNAPTAATAPRAFNQSVGILARSSSVVADNNVFFTTGRYLGFGTHSRLGASFASLRGNALVGVPNGAAIQTGDEGVAERTLLAYQNFLGTGIASGNAAYTNPALVLKRPSPDAWTTEPFTALDLVDAPPCAIAKVTKTGTQMNDFLDRPRKDPPSAGAYQWTGANCQ